MSAEPFVTSVLLPQWHAPPNVHAAFTLRGGGVSAAPFDSLNLGTHVGDDPGSVAENRRRVSTVLGLPAAPVWLSQLHGANVLDADAPGAQQSRPGAPQSGRGALQSGTTPSNDAAALSADAVITRRSGVVCAVMVADCLPVLLAARDGSVIAAAHAGWRGLAAGVIENTVRAIGLPRGQILAWLGPSIGPAAFEVGEEVRQAFVTQQAQAASAFTPNERGRWLCDLPALARARLQALGVASIAGGQWCTVSDRSRFFSHRRNGRCGRMAALIWLGAPR